MSDADVERTGRARTVVEQVAVIHRWGELQEFANENGNLVWLIHNDVFVKRALDLWLATGIGAIDDALVAALIDHNRKGGEEDDR